MNPNRPKNASAMAPLAAVNRGLRNSRTSSMGSGRRSWDTANRARISRDPANPAMVVTEPQPCLGASMTVQTSRPTPAMDSAAPSGSKRPAFGSRDSGSSRQPAASAMITIGTLT